LISTLENVEDNISDEIVAAYNVICDKKNVVERKWTLLATILWSC